jgi:hypothetical protein
MSYMGDENKTPQPSHDKPQRPKKMPFNPPRDITPGNERKFEAGKNRPNINEDDVEFS